MVNQPLVYTIWNITFELELHLLADFLTYCRSAGWFMVVYHRQVCRTVVCVLMHENFEVVILFVLSLNIIWCRQSVTLVSSVYNWELLRTTLVFYFLTMEWNKKLSLWHYLIFCMKDWVCVSVGESTMKEDRTSWRKRLVLLFRVRERSVSWLVDILMPWNSKDAI